MIDAPWEAPLAITVHRNGKQVKQGESMTLNLARDSQRSRRGKNDLMLLVRHTVYDSHVDLAMKATCLTDGYLMYSLSQDTVANCSA